MSRLEDMAIAKLRDRMSKASIVELVEIKKELKVKCKGGHQHMIFDEVLLRDLYAYVVIGYLNMYGFSVFGGFVAAHLSGKFWNDIDVIMPSDSRGDFDHIMGIVKFLRFSFGFKPTALQLHDVSSRQIYARGVMLHITDGNMKHKIKIDVVPRSCGANMRWLPVSVGRCLVMKDNVISLRVIQSATLLLLGWRVEDVIELLRDGKDVGLMCPKLSSRQAYNEYYVKRIEAMRQLGYVVDTRTLATN